MAKEVKDQSKPLTPKQKDFLKAFKINACNVAQSCEKMGINRSTFYEWCNKSDTFKKEVENERESILDMAESQLYNNILDGKEASIFFILKTKGKSRGYVEKQELDVGISPIETVTRKYVG